LNAKNKKKNFASNESPEVDNSKESK